MLVVGLGNPGDEYAATRHNVGFMVAEELARRCGGQWSVRGGLYAQARVRIGPTPVVLCKPLTYMNNSGTAVAEILRYTGSDASALLVVADDLALPLGKLRLRKRGSDGGHNGLTSVIFELNSNEFTRLRCGIGPETTPPRGMMADFVLSPFDRNEAPEAGAMIRRAADAVSEVAREGYTSAMNKFST
jgi:peptidyl-tRNA hydrolase, PTH1 family